MNRYEVIKTVGEGTYGVVMQCVDRVHHRLVAVKRFKHFNSNAYVRRTMARELRAQQLLRGEPYVVQLLEAFKEGGTLHLVMDYIEHNLLDMLDRHPDGLSVDSVRRLLFTLLLGVRSCHRAGIVHRDIKPENILVREEEGTATLCDFGFSRPKLNIHGTSHHHHHNSSSIGTSPSSLASLHQPYQQDQRGRARSSSLLSLENESLENEKGIMTDYVATRWYRSPEMLLGFSHYSFPVDLWAVGAIMAEACDGQPLLPGKTEVEQMHLIRSRIGPLPLSYESALVARVGSKQAGLVRGGVTGQDIPDEEAAGIDIEEDEPIDPNFLEDRFGPLIGDDGVHLMRRLLTIDSRERISVEEALQHPFFDGLVDVYDPLADVMETNVTVVRSPMGDLYEEAVEKEAVEKDKLTAAAEPCEAPATDVEGLCRGPHENLSPEVPPAPAPSLRPAPVLSPPAPAPVASPQTFLAACGSPTPASLPLTSAITSTSVPVAYSHLHSVALHDTGNHNPSEVPTTSGRLGRRADELLELSLSTSVTEEEDNGQEQKSQPTIQRETNLVASPRSTTSTTAVDVLTTYSDDDNVAVLPVRQPAPPPAKLRTTRGVEEKKLYREVISVDSLESCGLESCGGTPRSALGGNTSHPQKQSGGKTSSSGRRHHHKHHHHHSGSGSTSGLELDNGTKVPEGGECGVAVPGTNTSSSKRGASSSSGGGGGGMPTLLFRSRRSMSPMTLSYAETEWMGSGGGGGLGNADAAGGSKPPSTDGRSGTAAGNRPTPTLRRPTPQQQGKISTCSSLSVGSISFTASPQTAFGARGGSSSSTATSPQHQQTYSPQQHPPPPPRPHHQESTSSMESSHGECVVPLGGGPGVGKGMSAPSSAGTGAGGSALMSMMPQKRLSTFKGGASPSSDNGLSVVSGVGGGGGGRLASLPDTGMLLPPATLYSPNTTTVPHSHRSQGSGFAPAKMTTSVPAPGVTGGGSAGPVGAFAPPRRNSTSLVDSGRQPQERVQQSISSAGQQHLSHHQTTTSIPAHTTTHGSIGSGSPPQTQINTIHANYLHLSHNSNFPSKTVVSPTPTEGNSQWFMPTAYPMQNTQPQVKSGTSKKKSRLVLRE